MAEQSFESFITAERERLSSERAALYDQQHELEQKLEAINKEMAAITAYEAVKTGKAAPAPGDAPRERKPRAAAAEAPRRARAPRGSGAGIRQQVLDMIRSRDGGATAADLYAFLEAHDKPAQQSVNNALAGLKKEGAITQAGRRQPYTATENAAEDQQEAA